MIINKKLELTYNLSFGVMSKWLTELTKGQALALKCSNCSNVSFPPQKVCSCGSNRSSWIKLSGVAKILSKTSGQDGSYAIAKFEGCSSSSVVRLKNFKGIETVGKLVPSCMSSPSIILIPIGR